jgi:FkbM family methyltransferase
MSHRIRRAARGRILRALGDEAIAREAAARINHAEAGSDLLTVFAGHLRSKSAAALTEQLTPVGELDYAPHPIRIVLSSPAMSKRLESVDKEPFTVEWIERYVTAGDCFYDIGANVGAYSLIAAKATGGGAQIFAFEPSPATFHDLSRNVLLNGCADSVVPVPLALWSESRLLSIGYKSPEAGAARHRLTEGTEAGGRAGRRETQTIVAAALDDLVEGFGFPVPTHAKVDVDGYELQVLRGAGRTLRRPEWRSIIVELDTDDTERNASIKALLADSGLGHALKHERTPSARYPDPGRRPDVYWTFSRE